MNNLKDLAVRAKNRLLNKGLRETYTNANTISCTNMNFFNNDRRDNCNENSGPFKYLLREDRIMSMTPEDRERLILNTIRQYQEEKKNKNVI